MNKNKKIALVSSLGLLGLTTMTPVVAFVSTSCSNSEVFDTSKFSYKKYSKYVSLDKNGRRCLVIPNGTK